MERKVYRFLLLAGTTGLVLGAAGMWNRLVHGHIGMAYGSYVPWGLWVAFDIFFFGLTAGAYLITVSAYGFGLKRLEPFAPLAVFTLLVSLLCEGIIIGLDLGHMPRVYRFFITPNFGSMLAWLVFFVAGMWLVYLLMFFFLVRERIILSARDNGNALSRLFRALGPGRTAYGEDDRRRDHARVRALVLISIPLGLLFFALPGAMFSVVPDRPSWSGALTPIMFIAAAFLSGGALVTFLACMYYRQEDIHPFLGRAVLAALAVFSLLELSQIFVGYRSSHPGAMAALDSVIFGPRWWVFWLVHILPGTLIPLVLLTAYPRDARHVALACFLVVATFIAARYSFVISGMTAYNLGGIDQAFVHRRLSASYAPNLNEWLVSLWVVSLWLVVFLIGTRLLPVTPSGKGGPEHV